MLERISEIQTERSEILKPKPYVVSGDIKLLLQDWANQRGFKLPDNEFFKNLRGSFNTFMSRVFRGYEFVPEEELIEGITSKLETIGLPVVSLDRVYYRSELPLEITRVVGMSGKNRGLGRRVGTPPLLRQFKDLKEKGITEIVLVDDVIFSGDLIKRTGDLLNKIGIKVPVVCAGIGITEGIEQLNCFGQDVQCVRIYDDVIDEICERDFYPGVPMCGRSLDGDENIGVPYILPFGSPGKWASIPDGWQIPLSRFSLNQSIKLFETIENASGKQVECRDLDRQVKSLPNNSTRFVDSLKETLRNLE